MNNFRKLKNEAIELVDKMYHEETQKMSSICVTGNEGKFRKFSELLIEDMVQCILSAVSYYTGVDIVSKKGNENTFPVSYYRNIAYYKLDRHNYVDGNLTMLIENKSNLDSAYFKRALADINGIIRHFQDNGIQLNGVKAAIVCGVKSLSDDTYTVEKQVHYGRKNNKLIPVETFYLFKGKRNQKVPIYEGESIINRKGVEDFIDYVISTIKPKYTEEEMNEMEPFSYNGFVHSDSYSYFSGELFD